MLARLLVFLEQFLPSLDACEAACSVIKMIYKLLKDCMGFSWISSDDTASALRLCVSSGNIFQTSHTNAILHPVMAWNMHWRP